MYLSREEIKVAKIDIKCGCGYSFEKEVKCEEEIAFCESCGSLVINVLAPEIEAKIERVNQIREEIKRLEKEKKRLDLDIRIGMEGAPVAIGKRYQLKDSSFTTKRFDTQAFKFDHEESYGDYVYESRVEKLTIKEL